MVLMEFDGERKTIQDESLASTRQSVPSLILASDKFVNKSENFDLLDAGSCTTQRQSRAPISNCIIFLDAIVLVSYALHQNFAAFCGERTLTVHELQGEFSQL